METFKTVGRILFSVVIGLLLFTVFALIFACQVLSARTVYAEAETDDIIISSAQEFISFAKSCSSVNKYSNRKVYLSNDIDLSEESFADYNISNFAGYFSGEYNGKHYAIRGINLPVGTNVALFSSLSGTVENLSLYAEVDGNNSENIQGTGSVAVVAGKATSGAYINNCYINIKLNTASELSVNFYAVACKASGSAKFDNLYIVSDSTIYLFKSNSNHNNKETNIYAICENVNLANGESSINISSPQENDYWVNSSGMILKIMQPNGTSSEDDDTSEPQKPDDNPVSEPKELTPCLVTSTFYYSNSAPTLNVNFAEINDSEEVKYQVIFAENQTWDVGEYSAKIQLEDTQNYKLTCDVVGFKIIPYPIEINWATESLIYNGKNQTPQFSFEKVDFEPDLTFEFEQNDYVDANTYTATLKEQNNFEIINPSIKFKIEPYTIKIEWSNFDLIYNGEPQIPTASFIKNEITKDVVLDYINRQTNAWSELYTGAVSITGNNNNIKLENATCQFRISPAIITVDWNETNEFEYNAKKQVRGYTLILPEFAKQENFYAEIYGKNNESNASVAVGEYSIEIKSKDTANYFIKNWEATYKITKYKLHIAWSENTTLIYNGQPQMPSYTTKLPEFCDSLYIEELGKDTNVGTDYLASLFVNDAYIEIENPHCKYSIEPYIINIEWGNTQLTYNGANQHPTAKCSNLDFEKVELSVSESGKNQGKYTSSVTIISENANNFVLQNSTTEFSILPFVFVPEWGETQLVYNACPQAPSIKNKLPSYADEISITYTSTGIDVGDYDTSIEFENNENGNFVIQNSSCKFCIVPETVKVVWSENLFTYNGENQFPKFEFNKNFATQYSINNEYKNVGNYTAQISSKSKNYSFENYTFEYSIEPYKISLIWEDTVLEYNTYPQKPVAKYQKFAFCNALDIIISGEQTDVGEYTATAEISNNDYNNFVLQNTECKYQIIQKEIRINWENVEVVYDGKAHKPQFTIDSNDGVEIQCAEYTDSGVYEITASTTNSNYKLLNNTTTFTILSKVIEVEWNNCEFEYDANLHCPQAFYQDVELEISNAQKYVGTYTATCASKNKNYIVQNPTQNYTIKKYQIAIEWLEDTFVYNATSQIPEANFDLPNFANQQDFIIKGAQIDVGNNYIAELVCCDSNFELLNNQKEYAITPYIVHIEWGNTTLIYNGELQYPKFDYVNNDLTDNLNIVAQNIGKSIGNYSVELKLDDLNYKLENLSTDYQITPYIIKIDWEDRNFEYNAKPQAPRCMFTKPKFETDLQIVEPSGYINAGTHTAVAKLSTESIDANNFVLDNETKTYEIEPYTLELVWGDVDSIYSGELHIPTATYLNDTIFGTLPQLSISGGAVAVGSYTAIAKIEDTNFVLANPTCTYTIYPQAVNCEGVQATIQVSVPNKDIQEKLEVKEITTQDFAIPHGQKFLFGFQISSIVQIPTPMAKIFAIQTVSSENENNYFVKLYLADDFVMPDDAKLYLYADDGYTTLNYEIKGNTISFTTSKLGMIYVATPESNSVFLPLAITFGSVTIVSACVLVYCEIKYKKSKQVNKK